MLKHKKIKIFMLIIAITACLITFISCSNNSSAKNEDAHTNQSAVQDKVEQDIATEDSIKNRVSFNKKYYSLGYNTCTKNEYYTFCDDGNACYTHIMQDGENIIFHQEIYFKWSYNGEGDCILLHNGTKMIKGQQDDSFGIARVMHLGKDVVYWSTSGENTYFICEDFISQIPNYAKLIKEN